ncbi:hypothetical protein PFICI_03562 [Pestalotiopsis fici W106-1]|uniref:Extracellular membrane protein CFEM domain-containing protein n=1 Tax=Pestalotiopsis fici (strain W106-1 / CGMCC3.15140) TaxID=1229662 RepID=W3XJA5_PESFW|nr:uncharacterized protein PFICI_03562 [Pestalotiopsis fici W106-1]ETS85537.1 hypothetical protein PFICI_03562 [Pestalotiopsis fici W106-1]
MQLIAQLASLALLLKVVVAENVVDTGDVPSACRSDSNCQQVFTIGTTCDDQTRNESDYNNCVCGTSNAQSILNTCAICVYNNEDRDDDDRVDNDVTELMRTCGWTLDLAAATTSTSGSSSTTSTTTPTPTVATITTSGTTLVTTQTPSITAGSASSSTTPNAASVPTAAAANVLAGAFFALAMI